MTPINMKEAQQQPPMLKLTIQTWAPVQLMAITSSSSFVRTEDKVIALLTNGKFTKAHFFAYLLLVVVPIQTGERCKTSFLVVRGHGYIYACINALSIARALIPLFLPVPFIEVAGTSSATTIPALVIRIGAITPVRKYHQIAFQDGTLIVGFGGSVLSAILVFVFASPFELRAMAAFLALANSLFSHTELLPNFSTVVGPAPAQHCMRTQSSRRSPNGNA